MPTRTIAQLYSVPCTSPRLAPPIAGHLSYMPASRLPIWLPYMRLIYSRAQELPLSQSCPAGACTTLPLDSRAQRARRELSIIRLVGEIGSFRYGRLPRCWVRWGAAAARLDFERGAPRAARPPSRDAARHSRPAEARAAAAPAATAATWAASQAAMAVLRRPEMGEFSRSSKMKETARRTICVEKETSRGLPPTEGSRGSTGESTHSTRCDMGSQR